MRWTDEARATADRVGRVIAELRNPGTFLDEVDTSHLTQSEVLAVRAALGFAVDPDLCDDSARTERREVPRG